MDGKGSVKKLIAMRPEQAKALRQLKSKHGINQNHVIREGIDLVLVGYSNLLAQTGTTQDNAERV
jgi:Ribbon-helix-helix domain